MGAAYKDACFGDALHAASSMCSTEFPRTDSDSAGNLRVLSCSVVDGSTIAVAAQIPALGASSSTAVPVSFVACNEWEQYTRANDVFIDCLAALVAVGILKAIYRRFSVNL